MDHLVPPDPDRLRGAFLGLAVGDALSTTLEFAPPGSFEPLEDMVGGGPFDLPPGAWTDDTAMAACLAESLVATGRFDPTDQMQRYLRWYREGHWSSTGACFDIGGTTRTALEAFERSGDPASGGTDPHSAGNGSIMRLAPVPGLWEAAPLHPCIDEVAAGSYLRRQPPEIRGGGYVVASLEAALWAFATTADYRGAALALREPLERLAEGLVAMASPRQHD